MAKPLVAVVGRPNVGKSTFFNKIAGRRIAIVEDTPGVTRDRIYTDVEWQNHHFTLIDTGGIDPHSEDPLLSQMRAQAEIAMETCDLILFFVDARSGMTADDEEVANLLRKAQKPVLLVVNKVDSPQQQNEVYDFYTLGLGDPIPISSTNMLGLGDLLEEVIQRLPAVSETTADETTIQIAVVGKPNVGKSSLVNRILGESRTMVSDIPGTTRDAIDSPFESGGISYNIIDTAGIRRKRAIEENSIERYSIVRALGAVRRCDVALLVIDATSGVTEQDTKIAGYILEEGKAAVVLINKWDALEKDTGTMETYQKQVRADLKFMPYAPILFISALTGQRVPKVLESVREAYTQYTRRITTGVLNDVINDAVTALPPPQVSGRRLKIYYATQQSAAPPTFVFFLNEEKLMHFAYERYLENQLRKAFGFAGTPLRFILREKKKEA